MILVARKSTALGESVDVLEGSHYFYFGRVLRPECVKAFKETHKTVLAEAVYKAIDEKKLIQELNELTGEDCGIEIIKHPLEEEVVRRTGKYSPAARPTYLVYRKPHYWIMVEPDTQDYILYNYDEEIAKMSRSEIFNSEGFNKNQNYLDNAKRIFKQQYEIELIKMKRW